MDIIGKRLWFFTISGVLILICIISLATLGLRTGVEFSSGSLLNISFEQQVNQDDLKTQMGVLGHPGALIQSTGAGDYIIRTSELDDAAKAQLLDGLRAYFGTVQENESDRVSPMIATETARNAGIAIIIAAIAMLLYIAWAFRRMPSPFRFGTCAIIGLVFDALIALGVFSVLGGIWGWEINLMFITGILAVIGYSVNNTVVVFDRIRENVSRGISPDFEYTTNTSVVQTFGRSINTTLTTLFTLLALALFVGASIQNFVMVLIIGVIAGLFSSTCITPSLLVAWHKKKLGGFSKRNNLVTVKTRS